MGLFDTILLIAWAGFVFYGLFFGLLRMVGGFVGLIFGVFLASRFYLDIFEIFAPAFGDFAFLGKIVTFLLLLGIITKLASFGFAILEKMFSLLSVIPFVKTFNRLGGAILGLLIGGLVLGLVLNLAQSTVIVNSITAQSIASSKISPVLMFISKLFYPLLPKAFITFQELI